MRSTGAKMVIPHMLVLGALAGAGLGWVITAGFNSNLTAMLATNHSTPTQSSASASEEVGRPWLNDVVASGAVPERDGTARLERWWMDVQGSVERAE